MGWRTTDVMRGLKSLAENERTLPNLCAKLAEIYELPSVEHVSKNAVLETLSVMRKLEYVSEHNGLYEVLRDVCTKKDGTPIEVEDMRVTERIQELKAMGR